MQNEKTFNVAGFSTLNGVVKLRVAKDMKRAKVLERNGHTDIQLVELPEPMTREQAAAFLGLDKVAATEAVAETQAA